MQVLPGGWISPQALLVDFHEVDVQMVRRILASSRNDPERDSWHAACKFRPCNFDIRARPGRDQVIIDMMRPLRERSRCSEKLKLPP
jgi:hypothetical protein